MSLIYLELSDETIANSLQAKTKTFTALADDYSEVDEAVVSVGAGWWVRVAAGMDISESTGVLIATHEKLPEQELLDNTQEAVSLATEAGFDLYKRLIADINIHGGLNPSLDESIRLYVGADSVATMIISLDNIRCMLKDHFVEFAFRAMAVFLDPGIGFSTEQITKYKSWLRDEAVKSGQLSAVMDALEAAPKGAV